MPTAGGGESWGRVSRRSGLTAVSEYPVSHMGSHPMSLQPRQPTSELPGGLARPSPHRLLSTSPPRVRASNSHAPLGSGAAGAAGAAPPHPFSSWRQGWHGEAGPGMGWDGSPGTGWPDGGPRPVDHDSATYDRASGARVLVPVRPRLRGGTYLPSVPHRRSACTHTPYAAGRALGGCRAWVARAASPPPAGLWTVAATSGGGMCGAA